MTKRAKPIRLSPVEQYKLTQIVLATKIGTMDQFLAQAEAQGLTRVNTNHVLGIAKAHGIPITLKRPRLDPQVKAARVRDQYIDACVAAEVEPDKFLSQAMEATA